ncbi:MAG: hypothetical protein ACFE9S_04370 [Candidatus Hermodarchaeota archaeon]
MMQTTQQIKRLVVTEIYDLAEFREILESKLYVPDIHVRKIVILELLSYLEEKLKAPNYKIKIFAAYNEIEVCGFVICQIDPYYTSYSRKCGTFGWLHANNFETCRELIRACESFVRENRIRKIRGCISFPKNLGGLGIQFMGFNQQIIYGVGYTKPGAKLIEYLTRLGYKNDSEYTCVRVTQQSWNKGKKVDKSIRLGFPTLEELYDYTDAIRELANNSFYQIMPDGSGRNRVLDFFEAYSKLPQSFYKLKTDVVLTEYSTIPEYIKAWESCDLEQIQPYVPMAFDRYTDELVGIILCLPDLYEAWRGDPITRVNVDTAMVKKGYYGKGIFSALNNIGQLTCLMRGLSYYEGTSIWSNNTRAIDTIFPHSKPIRKHSVLQKRL